MALQLPGCVGNLNSSLRPCNVRRSRRISTFATLSQPRGDAVNWVEATSRFFENDTRPIMLFDGKIKSVILFLQIFGVSEFLSMSKLLLFQIPIHLTDSSTRLLDEIYFSVWWQVYATCVMGV